MKSIPVVGIPHYNRPDLTARCIASIDYPVDKLVIVNNGPERIEVDEWIMDATAEATNTIREVCIIAHPNAGVAGAWNEIIKLFPAPYWLISNNDIQFAPGDLAKMVAFVTEVEWFVCAECGQRFSCEQFNSNSGFCPRCVPVVGLRPSKKIMKGFTPGVIYGNHGASWFSVTAGCVEKVGLFDENIYPAYLEDCDYSRRCDLLNVTRHTLEGVSAIHGDASRNILGSTTVYSDPGLAEKNQRTHGGNFDYYRAKWGGVNEQEKFPTPFNSPAWPIWAWRFDPHHRKEQQW